MTAVGVGLSLNGLSKVELGNRELRLDELIALAAALDVAPVLLIFPLGHEEQVELFPGIEAGTWAALKWFTGQDRFPVCMPKAAWIDVDLALPELATTLFREQNELVDRLSQISARLSMTQNRIGALAADGEEAKEERALAESLQEMLETAENQLRRQRTFIRRSNLDPGKLPPHLVHIRSEEHTSDSSHPSISRMPSSA